jgi:hypothetical protein
MSVRVTSEWSAIMGVDEAGQDGAPPEVDSSRARGGEVQHVAIASYGQDAVARDGDRIRAWLGVSTVKKRPL